MGTSKNTFAIVLHVEIANRIKTLLNGKSKKYDNPSQAVNEILKICFDVKETLDSHYYHLSMRAIGTDLIEIEDAIREAVAEVVVAYDNKLKRHRLYCRLDENFTCEHVAFAVIRPEIKQLQDIEKLPKVKDNLQQRFFRAKHNFSVSKKSLVSYLIPLSVFAFYRTLIHPYATADLLNAIGLPVQLLGG
jgi:hypothetical protein